MLALLSSQLLRSTRHQHVSGSNIALLCWQEVMHESPAHGVRSVPILKSFSKVILASNVTPNITRSAYSFSTVPSRVNGVAWGWTVRDLETCKINFSSYYHTITAKQLLVNSQNKTSWLLREMTLCFPYHQLIVLQHSYALSDRFRL